MLQNELIGKNLWRNRRRTLLTVASVAISTFLLAIFFATYRYINAPTEVERYNLVLVVAPRASISVLLPLSYRERIEKVPGVVAVTPISYFDGRYGSAETLVPAVACDPEVLWKVSDLTLSQEERQAFIKERTAAIVARKIANKYGWKIGDRVHLSSPYFRVTLDLNLRGIYDSRQEETYVFFHWAYLNEAMGRIDKTQDFEVLARSVDDIPRLTRDIDALFRNADVETRTQTLKQQFLDFLGWLGNVKLILVGVSGAVVFTILLIVANTMAMSIRERTEEIAVLRALGFRTSHVLGLLIGESLAISLLGAMPGCLGAWLLFRLTEGYALGGLLPLHIRVDFPTVVAALGVAIAISLASTLIPAYRAARANIARALRFVG